MIRGSQELIEIKKRVHRYKKRSPEEKIRELNTSHYNCLHFDGGDAERPDVGAVVVAGLFDDLGSHPVGRSDKGGPLLPPRQLSGHSKVRQLHRSVRSQQHVGRYPSR